MKLLILILMSVVAVASVMAQEVPVEGFDWITSIILFLKGVPHVGPVLIQVFYIAGIVAVVSTALALCIETVLTIPEIAARWAGSFVVVEKIQWFKNKVLPWIKYLSMFNVQKAKK